MLYAIPAIVTQGFLAALPALVTGVLGWRGGEKLGKEKVHADYINAIQGAASSVISELRTEISNSRLHEEECVKALSGVRADAEEMKAKIDEWMRGPTAIYRPGSTENME